MPGIERQPGGRFVHPRGIARGQDGAFGPESVKIPGPEIKSCRADALAVFDDQIGNADLFDEPYPGVLYFFGQDRFQVATVPIDEILTRLLKGLGPYVGPALPQSHGNADGFEVFDQAFDVADEGTLGQPDIDQPLGDLVIPL